MRIVKMLIEGLNITEETIITELPETEACETCELLNQHNPNEYCYYQVRPE